MGTRVVADFLEADGWEVLLLGPGAPADDITALVESEQPDLVALSTATAGVLDGVVEVLRALARSARGRASSPAASSGPPRRAPTALEFGADLVVQDPRELVALLHERIPPLAACDDPRRARPPTPAPCSRCSTRRSSGSSRAGRPASGAASRSRPSRRGSRSRPAGPRAAACESPSATARPVGALVLGSHPEWVAPAGEPERYIEALVTSRAHAGQDIGGALVRRAVEETRAAGISAAACGLLGRSAATGGLVRAPGLRAQRHLRRAGLARPGLLATLSESSRWCSHRSPLWKSRNVFAASAVMPVSPATRPASWLSSGPGRVWVRVSMRAPEHGYRPLDTRAQSLPSDAPRSFALVAAMTMCPRCGSTFLQPLRCEAKGSDVVRRRAALPGLHDVAEGAAHARRHARAGSPSGGVPRRDRGPVRAAGGREHGGARRLPRPGAGAGPRLRGRLRRHPRRAPDRRALCGRSGPRSRSSSPSDADKAPTTIDQDARAACPDAARACTT